MLISPLKELAIKIDDCMLGDQFRLRRKLSSIAKRQQANKPSDKLQSELEAAIHKSQQQVEERRSSQPLVSFPDDLPVAEKRDEIAQAIAAHQVVVVAGETGSGKTTQLPKICMELGRGIRGLIGHTQPRRLAARSVAQRIADELKSPLGDVVGYQVRFTDQTSPSSYLKLMTDGILLAEIQHDKYLHRYDTLIIDEAHERSLNIDFILGYIKTILPKRPDLKVIITSATIDVERFSEHFNNAPVIEVSGRTFPVEVRYRPPHEFEDDRDLAGAIEEAINELADGEGSSQGDVLVFLSGEAQIREVAKQLRRSSLEHCEVLPLYARLSNAEQNKIFSTSKRVGRRVVLATNVAETSLTVPGIRYVIDSGYARISRYSYRTKVQRLPIEAISQASANQRKGRCGRVAEGICIRLYSEEDFMGRPEFTDPEILRTNLASVILQMLNLRIGDIQQFPFLEPPDRRLINDGFKLLEELGAIDTRRHMQALGKSLSRFTIEPRLGRILIEASKQGALKECLIIAAALSIQDPRERPADKQQASDEKHRRFRDEDSDFVSFVNLWNYFEQQRQELSQNQLRKLCKKEFLSYLRMKEWRDIHRQLLLLCKDLGLKENSQAADYERIHRSILAGFMSQVAMLHEKPEYLGARNRKLFIFPGSGQFKKTPKWLVAAEIAETTQVYARCCARIDPEWLIGINDRVFKRSYSEAHWQQRTGRVMANERLSLYGLTIREKKRVHYGPIDPVVSRELFIRSALVEGRYNSKAAFFVHNQALVKEIESLEDKSRKKDILVDDQQVFEFYNERLAEGLITAKHFEKWLKDNERENPKLLFLSKSDLMQHGADAITEAQFPTQVRCGDTHFTLSYFFRPGHASDGVTVDVPISLLNRVPRHRFEWLVPGMLKDKCIALIKALPKQLRKQFVPVPEFVDRLLSEINAGDQPLLESMSEAIFKLNKVRVDIEQWQPQQLDDFYRVNYRLLDEDGKVLEQSRDLNSLVSKYKGQVVSSLQEKTEKGFHKTQIEKWDFGELPATMSFDQAGVEVVAYPALVDTGKDVAIELKDFPEEAALSSQDGMVRLIMLQLPKQIKYLKKELLKGNDIALQLAGISQQRDAWLDQLIRSVIKRVFVEDQEECRTEADFEQRLATGRTKFMESAHQAGELLAEIASAYNGVRKQLKKANELVWAAAVMDINRQLQRLFAKDFIIDTPWEWLQEYPRYLRAIERRLEKLRGEYQRDKTLLQGLELLEQPLESHWSDNRQALRSCSELVEYRWLMEEYRVSLFAQQLGTKQPISEKRLKVLWEEVRKALANNKA